MARLSFRCDEDLVIEVDTLRGAIPRERFLRDIVEATVRELAANPSGNIRDVQAALAARVQSAPAMPKPYRQSVPGPNVENVRSSRQAKDGVEPRPKRGTT